MIFNFNEASRNIGLFLGRLRNKIGAKKNQETSSGSSVRWIPNPININKGWKSQWTRREIPWCNVPLTYLRTCLAASEWVKVGWCINWHSWWTLNAKSRRVNVKYWKSPTMLLNSVGSKREEPSVDKSLVQRQRGVFGGFCIFHVK